VPAPVCRCLEERTLEVSPREAPLELRRLVPLRGDLHARGGGPGRRPHRAGLRITTPSETPLVGESLDRFAVRRFATELASNSLAALRDWCELGHAAEPAREVRREPRASEVV
jgi:hypothetical protein